MLLKKKRQLVIQNNSVSVCDVGGQDYISLTDMVRAEDSVDHIRNWMRNRNTVEFLGLWEIMYNPDFKGVEFDTFKKQAGLNNFNLTPQKWVSATNAIGITSKAGRYGGTYAHKDIAFEFGTWISPAFKLYLIKEYQRLKEIEENEYHQEWNVRRLLTKTNYQFHTDAIKYHIIPQSTRSWNRGLEYADEADLLNTALFGCTAKEWREDNAENCKASENVRDFASINQLIILSNMEILNAEMIREGLDKKIRFERLQDLVKRQSSLLDSQDFMKSLRKLSDDVYVISPKNSDSA